MTGKYKDPVAVAAFDLNERWSGDVSEDIAHEIRRRAGRGHGNLPLVIEDFVNLNAGPNCQLALRFAQ